MDLLEIRNLLLSEMVFKFLDFVLEVLNVLEALPVLSIGLGLEFSDDNLVFFFDGRLFFELGILPLLVFGLSCFVVGDLLLEQGFFLFKGRV